MADFRKSILALAILALFTGVAANAQVASPFTCNANQAVPTMARSEGLTELLGDIVLKCNGGTAGATFKVNVSVFLANTNLTSRILNSSNASEGLLLIDEPNSGLAGATSGPNAFKSCSAAVATTGLCAADTNVYQGVVSGNRMDFYNVVINPTGTTLQDRILRVTNLRGNANAVGVGASGTPGQITAYVSIVGPATVPVTNPTQTVAFVQPGLAFSLRSASDVSKSSSGLTLSQCKKYGTGDGVAAVLRFSEKFGTAFKQRQSTVQNVPGAVYNTESGFILTDFSNSTVNSINTTYAGQADFGTRLKATFNNIPVGVNLWVSTVNVIGGVPATSTSNVYALLVAGDTVPAGSTISATDNFGPTGAKIPVSQITLSGGVATATWEVSATSSLSPDDVDFNVYFSSTPDLKNNLPTPNAQGTVAGAFAPAYTSAAGGSASSSLPISRFVDTGSASNFMSFVICRTNLLFPFVSNKYGFDTGLAIANTTTDPFKDTTAQTGTCTLNFYGDDAPAAWTTPAAIASGKVWTGLTQTIAPNFQGYVIAQCQFQMAHGFAFVCDVGARNLAMGYLALVIPDRTDNKRGEQVTITSGGVGETFGN